MRPKTVTEAGDQNVGLMDADSSRETIMLDDYIDVLEANDWDFFQHRADRRDRRPELEAAEANETWEVANCGFPEDGDDSEDALIDEDPFDAA